MITEFSQVSSANSMNFIDYSKLCFPIENNSETVFYFLKMHPFLMVRPSNAWQNKITLNRNCQITYCIVKPNSMQHKVATNLCEVTILTARLTFELDSSSNSWCKAIGLYGQYLMNNFRGLWLERNTRTFSMNWSPT